MLVLNRKAVQKSLSHADCIQVMESAMKVVSQRDVVMPLRQFMPVPHTQGKLGLMPGYLGGNEQAPSLNTFGIKIVSKFPREPGSPHSTHVGAVLIFDAKEGLPFALLDARELTAIRTSAMSALATKHLARSDVSTLCLMGCGEEAHHHIRAILEVRPLKRIIVWGRNPAKAEAFASEQDVPLGVSIEVEPKAASAVGQADIVCTVTSSPEPILKGEWLKPGTHVNLVGAAVRASAEADHDVVRCSRFYVDYLPSALGQAGELVNAIEAGVVTADHVAGEIGQVLLGEVAGRTSDQDITVYKSLGVSAQDLAAGLRAANQSLEHGIGVDVDW